MDGTLVDSVSAVTGAYADAVVAGGGTAPDAGTVVAAYSLGPPVVLLGALLGRACEPADLDAYHDALVSRSAAVVAYDGVPDALNALRGSVPMAVFTGASTRAADILLRAAGLRDAFATVVGGDQVTTSKPSPEGLVVACAALGVPPARAAYVGDAPLDLECARHAGCTSVAAAWGHLHDPDVPRDVTAAHPADVVAWALAQS
jgi:HAD superfamily hydrolase (TIGR01509 family)